MTLLYIVPFLLILATNAMILDWDKLQVSENTSIFAVAPIFSLDDTPMGNRLPSVSYNVSLTKTTNPTSKIRVHAILYSTTVISEIGKGPLVSTPPTGRVFCCTQALFGQRVCNVLGAFLISEVGLKSELIYYTTFEVAGDPVHREGSLNVTHSSNYVFQLTTCDLGGFTLSGSATWQSTYGYLPGDYIMSLPFSGVMSMMLCTVLFVLIIFMIKHRGALIRIQWGIFMVCFASLITSVAYFFYRLHNNQEGHYHIGSLVFVILLDMGKKTIARVLVLLLAMGYGVVKWTLGHIVMIKVAGLALGYFIFTFILIYWQETSVLAQFNKQPLGWSNFAVVIPQALIETLFFYWIMLSLIRTIQQLILRRQDLKLSMYKSFLGVLVVTGVLTLVMTLYVSFGVDRTSYTTSVSSWKNRWLIDGTWDLLFFVVLTSICILWRPRKNNIRYGAESLSRGDDRIINANEDDVAIPISEEFVYEGGGGRKRTGAKKSEEIIGLTAASKKGSNSDRDEYDNNREKSISVTGFNPEELSTFNQSILEIEIDEDDDKGVMDELSKID
jgi:hypothetical protein